jgi:hypothetical protein
MAPLWILAYLILWVALLIVCLVVFAVSREITELHKRIDMLYKYLVTQSSKSTDADCEKDMVLPDNEVSEKFEGTVNFESLETYTMGTVASEESHTEGK